MENEILLYPIAHVHNTRNTLDDDDWGNIVSEIILEPHFPNECLDGIETFSHIEVIYYFDRVEQGQKYPYSRHPRDNKSWPKVGIFAQRNKDRPNHIGLTIVRLIKGVSRGLLVAGLDAIDGTPVLDIKPVISEYLPREPIQQPDWSHELMKNYWHAQGNEKNI
jgi:tRNA-Thr(GGU) m(6)t(6)A37 methyltransferase TsaA